MILFCSQHVSKQMEKGQLTKPDYAYQRGRQFIRYEFALSTIANENNHEYNLIDALDLSSKRIDANITLAMQSRSRQSRTLDAMNLTWVVDSGCTRCALPKQLFKHINASRTTVAPAVGGKPAVCSPLKERLISPPSDAKSSLEPARLIACSGNVKLAGG